MQEKNELAKPRAHYTKKEKQLGIIPQDGYMRLGQLLSVLPISKSALYAGIATGRYPKPVRLSARTSAWRVEDIRNLIAELDGEA